MIKSQKQAGESRADEVQKITGLHVKNLCKSSSQMLILAHILSLSLDIDAHTPNIINRIYCNIKPDPTILKKVIYNGGVISLNRRQVSLLQGAKNLCSV